MYGSPIDFLSRKLVFLGSLDMWEPGSVDKEDKNGLEPFK
jgi:hypothetical protein